MNDIEEKISEILRNRKIKSISDSNLTRTAVLIPLCKRSGDYVIFFTKRLETLKRHAGQISFPGGIFDENDINVQKTAIRETYEELGIDENNIKVLGRLDDYASLSGYLISPFVGSIRSNCNFKVNRNEIEKLITIPLSDLMNISPRVRIRSHQGESHLIYYYDYRDQVIWGATARILKSFLELIAHTQN